jgi:uncharacterized protein
LIYLIDGHNLIGRLPDIDLADPNDEAILIERLRRWSAASRKRRLLVIFDAGLPGGHSREFSGGPVQVLFASSSSSADAMLLARIDAAHNPAEYTLVSDDRRIVQRARERRMPVESAADFAGRLPGEGGPSEPAAAPAEKPDPGAMSQRELEEWLRFFDEDDQA